MVLWTFFAGFQYRTLLRIGNPNLGPLSVATATLSIGGELLPLGPSSLPDASGSAPPPPGRPTAAFMLLPPMAVPGQPQTTLSPAPSLEWGPVLTAPKQPGTFPLTLTIQWNGGVTEVSLGEVEVVPFLLDVRNDYPAAAPVLIDAQDFYSTWTLQNNSSRTMRLGAFLLEIRTAAGGLLWSQPGSFGAFSDISPGEALTWTSKYLPTPREPGVYFLHLSFQAPPVFAIGQDPRLLPYPNFVGPYRFPFTIVTARPLTSQPAPRVIPPPAPLPPPSPELLVTAVADAEAAIERAASASALLEAAEAAKAAIASADAAARAATEAAAAEAAAQAAALKAKAAEAVANVRNVTAQTIAQGAEISPLEQPFPGAPEIQWGETEIRGTLPGVPLVNPSAQSLDLQAFLTVSYETDGNLVGRAKEGFVSPVITIPPGGSRLTGQLSNFIPLPSPAGRYLWGLTVLDLTSKRMLRTILSELVLPPMEATPSLALGGRITLPSSGMLDVSLLAAADEVVAQAFKVAADAVMKGAELTDRALAEAQATRAGMAAALVAAKQGGLAALLKLDRAEEIRASVSAIRNLQPPAPPYDLSAAFAKPIIEGLALLTLGTTALKQVFGGREGRVTGLELINLSHKPVTFQAFLPLSFKEAEGSATEHLLKTPLGSSASTPRIHLGPWIRLALGPLANVIPEKAPKGLYIWNLVVLDPSIPGSFFAVKRLITSKIEAFR